MRVEEVSSWDLRPLTWRRALTSRWTRLTTVNPACCFRNVRTGVRVPVDVAFFSQPTLYVYIYIYRERERERERASLFRRKLGISGNHGSENWERNFKNKCRARSDTFLAKCKNKEARFSETTSARCIWVWLPECIRGLHSFLHTLSTCISVAGRNAWRQFILCRISCLLHDVASTNNDEPCFKDMLPHAFRRRVEMHSFLPGGGAFGILITFLRMWPGHGKLI